MRKLTTRIALVSFALFMLFNMAIAAPISICERFNIDELLLKADETFNLESQDAVILFEGYKERLFADGHKATFVHRIVWISTEWSLDEYADLRVPWDSDRNNLDVFGLRVWTKDRWIDHRPTAIVETLPYEVSHAPDYANLRETMLLHDGVELPCVLEVAYMIDEKEVGNGELDGNYDFQFASPVMISNLILEVPEGKQVNFSAGNGVPTVEKSVKDGFDSYMWTVEQQAAAPVPATNDPAAYLPHVTWSTWGDWDSYGAALKEKFVAKLGLDEKLAELLPEIIEDAVSPSDIAHKIAAFVDDNTTFINYDENWMWSEMRTAGRIYDTGYASGIDRAILASSLMNEAGLETWPVYRSAGFGDINDDVVIATNARMSDIAVWASAEGLEGYYDTHTSTLANGLAPIFGRTIWLPGSEDRPTVRWSGKGESSKFEINATIHYSEEHGRWGGNGFVNSTGGYCLFDEMEGVSNDAEAVIEDIVGGIFDDVQIHGYNPVSFDRFGVSAGFDFCAASKVDGFERRVLSICEPGNGPVATLPGDIHLYTENREAPVALAGNAFQKVQITIELDGLEVVHLPEAVMVENEAGKFELTVVQSDDKVVITRTLNIVKPDYAPEEWAAFKSLLLTETAKKNRTLMFK